MKHLLTFLFLLLTLLTLTVQAQPGAMSFAGPSKFGIASMNAWQENASDTLVLEMTSETEAKLTFPSLTYNVMAMTLPSFTVQSLKFEYDPATHDASFPEQKFQTSVLVDGKEKLIEGYSFVAAYNHASQSFEVTARFNYGTMPVSLGGVTYILSATYVVPASALTAIEATAAPVQPAYDLQGRRQPNNRVGQIMVVDGKKCIIYNN